MPLYEYQCQQCGKRSETLQNMGAAPLTTCEVCGGPLKRLVSSPAVQFKGSGFYATDYARKGGGGAGKGMPPTRSKARVVAPFGGQTLLKCPWRRQVDTSD